MRRFITILTLLYLCDSREIIFVGQLIPLLYYSYNPLNILSTVLHGYLYRTTQISIQIIGGITVVYIYYLKMFIINDFKKHYKTHDSFRYSHNIVHLYRRVKILHEQTLCFLGQVITIRHVLLCILPLC